MSAVVLAHQGGWDELLMVLGPLLAIGGLLALAKWRAGRQNADSKAGSKPS